MLMRLPLRPGRIWRRPESRTSRMACSALVTRLRKTWMSWLASAMTPGSVVSGRKSTSMLLRRSECSWSWSVRSTRLLTSTSFFCAEARKDHAFDVTPFIGERTEGETNAAPIALLVADTELHGSNGLLPGKNVLADGCGRRQILRMGAAAELHVLRFLKRVAQHVLTARAD